MTKTQFNDGTLNNQLNSKSLLNADQFVSGIQTERLKMKTLKTGEIVTSTGLILETDDMVNGEVWGDKHDKKDKLNQQVTFLKLDNTFDFFSLKFDLKRFVFMPSFEIEFLGFK